MTHWPVICSYSAIACFGKRIQSVHSPKSRTRTQTTQISHKNWGKELISTQISRKYAWFSSPFSQDTPMEWTPLRKAESEMIFIFQKVKPTWNQPDLSSTYMAAFLLHLRNTSFASLLGDRRDPVGLNKRPDWLKTLSLAAELHGAEKSCKASGRRVANKSSLSKCNPTELLSCLFCMKMKETEKFV